MDKKQEGRIHTLIGEMHSLLSLFGNNKDSVNSPAIMVISSLVSRCINEINLLQETVASLEQVILKIDKATADSGNPPQSADKAQKQEYFEAKERVGEKEREIVLKSMVVTESAIPNKPILESEIENFFPFDGVLRMKELSLMRKVKKTKLADGGVSWSLV